MEVSFDELSNYVRRALHYFKKIQFTAKSQLAFLEDLHLLIKDGIPPNRAVEMMARISRKGIAREVAYSLMHKISQGQLLADGMEEWFSISAVEIIRVGEESGTLSETLQSAINMLSQQGIAIGTFIGSASYPLFVLIVACGVIYYLRHSVFEQFLTIKPLNEWPEAGKQFLILADFIESWWWLIILFVIALIITLRKIMSNYTGEFRGMLDKIPPFSFYKQLAAARLLETIGLLVQNGIVFKSAIKIMQYQATPYLNSHLVLIEHLLGTGKTNIAEVLGTGLIDEESLIRLKIMAEVKGFEHGLIRMGLRGTEKTINTIKLFSRIVGGSFLIIDGFLILAIIRGIYLTGMAMGAQ